MMTRTNLDRLENQSVFIFREAYHAFKNIAMPWSMGKDSNVLIWLASKAFFGRVPFPVLNIDTTYEFPEMLEFREWATAQYNLNLVVRVNDEAHIRRDKIPRPQTYFANNGERDGSLGCRPIAKPSASSTDTIEAIIIELETTRTSERAGRAHDHHERNAMQKLLAKGFL